MDHICVIRRLTSSWEAGVKMKVSQVYWEWQIKRTRMDEHLVCPATRIWTQCHEWNNQYTYQIDINFGMTERASSYMSNNHSTIRRNTRTTYHHRKPPYDHERSWSNQRWSSSSHWAGLAVTPCSSARNGGFRYGTGGDVGWLTTLLDSWELEQV